jgi:DNA-binding HxlR family transcriptional regulator
MHGYGQYCPLARGAEVLGDRWTLLIIREMLHGVTRFNELERYLPGISRSVLAQRLRHLTRTIRTSYPLLMVCRPVVSAGRLAGIWLL